MNFFFGVLGFIFGSFFAALSWRYPRNISITKGRSICPECKNKIAWYDNIPLLSFILLGGRCRNCKHTISWRYFLIELVTGVGFLFISINFGFDFLLLFYLLLIFSLLVLIFVVDLEHKIIPDSFVFFGITVSVITFLLIDSHAIFTRILAGFLGALILLVIHLITRGRGMGLGDVKFAVLAGIFIGLKMFLIWLLIAFLTGGIVGIILILFRRAGLKDEVPFGPFLIASILITFLWGEKILDSLWLN